jgi:uncharacterized membrane protein AbrB (regulator of aidB expression)
VRIPAEGCHTGHPRDAEWYLAHPLPAFTLIVAILATILFPTIGLITHSFLPAWGCLPISVVLGAALTASVWRAQRKFWREQRPPDAVP